MQLSKADKKLLTWFLIALIIALLPWVVLAQSPQKERINMHKASEDAYGYTQIVKAGNTIYLSGITGRGPMDESIQTVYERIGKALEAAGASFEDVVKENLFTTDLDEVKRNNAIRLKFYNGKYPAATWVQVDRLFNPEYNLEVEVVAVVDR